MPTDRKTLAMQTRSMDGREPSDAMAAKTDDTDAMAETRCTCMGHTR